MTDKKLFFFQSPPPVWKIIITALGITIAFFCLWEFIVGILYEEPSILPIFFAFVSLIFTLPLSATTNFHLDLEEGRFKEEIQLGLIKIGWWEPLFDFEYVSILGLSNGMFVLRLWFEKNQFFTVSGFDNEVLAIEEAKVVARIMNLDVWNATNPRNGFWMNNDEE